MRSLNTGDVFKVLQIFRAAGLKDEFAALIECATKKPDLSGIDSNDEVALEVAKEAAKENRAEMLGQKLFAVLFDCLGHENAEPLLIKLLADVGETSPDVLRKQSLGETIALVKAIAKENDVKSFFADAASLT